MDGTVAGASGNYDSSTAMSLKVTAISFFLTGPFAHQGTA
jgi:hypothetical protein